MEKINDNRWKYLWCGVTFQGINASKALAHVLGVRSVYVKILNEAIDKSYLSRYKDIQNYKAN